MTQDTHSSEPTDPQDDVVSAAEAVAGDHPEVPEETTKADPPEQLRKPTPAAAKLQPSWEMRASGDQDAREDLLARYRRQRGLPEAPFKETERPMPPPGYRGRVMNEPRPARPVERPAAEAKAAVPPVRAPMSFTLGQTFAIAAAMALVAGAGAGALSAWFSAHRGTAPNKPFASAPMADATPAEAMPPLQVAQAVAAHTTVIAKKPVSTATLQVADVSGETNSFIPLALHAEPANLGQDMLLKISGVPADAYLTSGHRDDNQIWSLSLAETKNVKLVVPQGHDPQIDLAVAAFEPGTGELAAPVKTMIVALRDVVVEPTSAPPPGLMAAVPVDGKSALPGASEAAVPVAIPLPGSVEVTMVSPEAPATQSLIASADSLFARGDVILARKTFERAWGNDGSAAAAFGIARSFDPLVLATLAGSNASPDKAQALQWYRRAADGGNPDAAEAITRLQLVP